MLITDIDLLKLEPSVYSDPFFTGQKRCGGANGLVAGTQFTAAGVDFIESQIAAGMVIYLASADNVIKGSYEITEILDSGHLLASQLRGNSTEPLIPIGSASGLTWSIKTYKPQFAAAENELAYVLRLRPAWPDGPYELSSLTNQEFVKQLLACRLLAQLFANLYGTMPAASDESAPAVWESHRKKHMDYKLTADMMLADLACRTNA